MGIGATERVRLKKEKAKKRRRALRLSLIPVALLFVIFCISSYCFRYHCLYRFIPDRTLTENNFRQIVLNQNLLLTQGYHVVSKEKNKTVLCKQIQNEKGYLDIIIRIEPEERLKEFIRQAHMQNSGGVYRKASSKEVSLKNLQNEPVNLTRTRIELACETCSVSFIEDAFENQNQITEEWMTVLKIAGCV